MMRAEQICRRAVTKGEIADLISLPESQRVLSPVFLRKLAQGLLRDAKGDKVIPQASGVRICGLVLEEELDLSNLDVPYPIELNQGRFSGRVSLRGAAVRSICLDESTFASPVDAAGLQIQSDFSAKMVRCKDWLSIAGAEIGGDLWLEGAELESRTQVNRLVSFGAEISVRVALDADRINVGGSVFLRSQAGDTRFIATGEVRLLGAKIGQQLNCRGGCFRNPAGPALSADSAEVGGSVFLDAANSSVRFESEGGVRLVGARIGGSVTCSGGLFKNTNGPALTADGLEVAGSVLFSSMNEDSRFEANGEIRLVGAKLRGQLNCIGGSFKNQAGYVLFADFVEIGDGFLTRCNHGHYPEFLGDISLVAAKIGSHLQWRDVRGNPLVDLGYAFTATLELNIITDQSCWHLNGFRYDSFVGPPVETEKVMLGLLKKSHFGGYYPQPYRQLFRVFRNMGNTQSATNVAVAMREHAFIHERAEINANRKFCWRVNTCLSYLWQGVLWLIGYGYRPWRAVFIAATLCFIGVVLYEHARTGLFLAVMAPADGDLLAKLQESPTHRWWEFGPPFVSVLYTLDRFMPIVDLGQASFYRPHASGHWFGWVLVVFDWILIVSGWILSLLLAGSVSGLMRKVEADH